jgi:hypothetical protein
MNAGIVPRIAQYFDSYFQHGCLLEFCTNLNATGTPYAVSWCFCGDYDHWERIGLTNSATTPSKAQILMMSNSQTFPGWTASQFIGIPSNNIRFSTAVPWVPSNAGVGVDFTAQSIATLRQTVCATAGMRVDGVAPAEDTTIGDIFLHLDLEFEDMNSVQTAAPNLRSMGGNRDFSMLSRKIEKLESLLDDRKNEHKTTKKSSSNKGVLQDFDKTLGYPGEGPFTAEPTELHAWCAKVLRTNLSYYRSRKELIDGIHAIVKEGGEYKIPTIKFSSIMSILSVRSDRFTDANSLALTTLIVDLYDELDTVEGDDDEKDQPKAKGKKKLEKEKTTSSPEE